MKLHCPHCGVKGSAEDSYSGRKVKCPKCQGVFTVEPDMGLELSEDATSVSTTPVESSLLASEVDTINLGEDRIEEPGIDDAVSVVAVDEQIEIAGDLAEPEAVVVSGGEEELEWEDVASEIDLQLDEAEGGEKEEDPIELEDPVDGFDLSEENDAETGDEASESRGVEAEEDSAQTMTDEITETAESVEGVEEKEEDPIELEDPVDGFDLSEENDDEAGDEASESRGVEAAEDSAQTMTDEITETAESVESVEEKEEDAPQEAVVASQDQSSAGPILADDGSGQTSDKISLGEVIRKTWAKIKNALSS